MAIIGRGGSKRQGLILAAGSVKYRSVGREAVGRNILINSILRIELVYTNIILSKASILLDVDFGIPVHGL